MPPLSPNGTISQAPKATETPRRFDALRTRPHLTLHTSFWPPKNHPKNRQKNTVFTADFPHSAASHLDPLNSMPTQPSWGLWGPTLGVVRMLVVGCFWCHDINSNPRQIEKSHANKIVVKRCKMTLLYTFHLLLDNYTCNPLQKSNWHLVGWPLFWCPLFENKTLGTCSSKFKAKYWVSSNEYMVR